jgi:hypothetical protein
LLFNKYFDYIIKKKTAKYRNNTLIWNNRKDALRTSKKLSGPHQGSRQAQGYESINSFERVSLKKKVPPRCLTQTGGTHTLSLSFQTSLI